MNAARFFSMQPLRTAMMRQPLRQTRAVHIQPTRQLKMQPTRAWMRTKEEEHSAHTITQRLRSLKKIPPELLPLGVVIAFAIFAAMFSMGRKLFTDKTLRLHKSKPESH